jgi:transcriptional regulator with GAF, ATPase, and Fis domain
MSETNLSDKLSPRERRGTAAVPRRQADRDLVDTLSRKLSAQLLLSQISAAFASVAADEMDTVIMDSLALLADYLQADRAYIIQLLNDASTVRTTYMWYAEGIERDAMVEQGIPSDHFSFVTEQTLSGADIVINGLHDLPDTAVNEYAYCQERGIKSFLMIPVYLEGKHIGNFGFDAIKRVNRWEPEQIEQLHTVSKLIATTLDRKKQAAHIDERLRFEQLINRLSATFINLPANEVEGTIEVALAEVAEFMHADFATFIQRDIVTGKLYHTHQWFAPGIELDMDFTDIDIKDVAPWLAKQMELGKPVVISRSNDFPEDAVQEREFRDQLGIKSVLWAPFYVSDEIAGYMVLNTMGQHVEWPEPLIEELKLVGEIFVNALMRKHSSESLNDRLCFENMLSSLSASFINLPDTEVDDRICIALQQIGEYAGVDEAFLFQFKASATDTGVTHSWYRSGQVREFSFEADQILELFPWAAGKFMNNEPVVFSAPGRLPTEASAERAYLENVGLKASVVIPLIFDSELRGLLFVQSFEEKQWRAHFSQQIHLAAQVFFSALQRKAVDQKLQAALTNISELKEQLEAENLMLQQEIETQSNHDEIVGSSPEMKRVITQAEQVAPLDSTVLIQGETGTGKELIANLIHKLSQREHKKMIRVNCAALPATLIEAELFGREKGAYTGAASKQVGRFELANGSTIFLDEIGELPLELQAKLLRVLQDGEFERLGSTQTVKVDVRVIAATNRDLTRLVEDGQFREDLYYRLNVFPITVPPLREHRMDIPALVWSFVRQYSETMGKSIDMISKNTMKHLQAYAWPGNVRELGNVIERAMILSQGGTLTVQIDTSDSQQQTGQTLAEIETGHIRSVLGQTGWRIRGEGGAAQILDMNPCTLESRMKKLGIKRLKK